MRDFLGFVFINDERFPVRGLDICIIKVMVTRQRQPREFK
jgi:hypothetical protein